MGGNHVLIHESQGTRSGLPQPNLAESEKQRKIKSHYKARILGRDVNILIWANSPEQSQELRKRLNEATAVINQHAQHLSPEDVQIIRNVSGITVDETKDTGVDPETGIYNIRPSYITSPGDTPVWLASTFAHEGYHVAQRKSGKVYNRQTAPALEREADDVQIRAGTVLGLLPYQIEALREDTHTRYNSPRY